MFTKAFIAEGSPIDLEQPLIAALDIGTSKIAAVVASVQSDGQLDLVGVGTAVSQGLRKGVVVNVEAATQAVRQAIEAAEQMVGCKIKSVFASIAGSHIRSFNSNGIVAIRNHSIRESDIERVLEAARAVAIPADQKILHVLPQEFTVDHQRGIRSPIGLPGVRLEATVHMITGAMSASDQIVHCIRDSHVQVEELVLEQLASSAAVLTENEKNLGVCLIDIGGGTTDIAVFVDGHIQYTAVLPVAGDQVTNDIAVALKTSTQDAESIKIQHAYALAELVTSDQRFEVSPLGDKNNRSCAQSTLAGFVEPRFEELLSLVQAELQKAGLEESLGAGVVLTGGSARMPGVLELAEEVLRLPVRLGIPQNVSGSTEVVHNPIYATAIGLLRYGYTLRNADRRFAPEQSNAQNSLWGRMRHWFRGHF